MFFIVAWFVRRFLDEQGIHNGTKRGILVFVIASLISMGAGEAVDWSQKKMESQKLTAKSSNDLPQLTKMINQIPQ
ncbi:hypothetical protein [Candidatus Nitrotoga sp. HW29]|uniref:hypothetical protein n=1 Tax=Candidatus Nitrotoga sp. HW29 TaxID=2886963 RepID=UPI001EF17C96|nr:hypothetical protein [Candidatus Nitrotoga sp. HW29]